MAKVKKNILGKPKPGLRGVSEEAARVSTVLQQALTAICIKPSSSHASDTDLRYQDGRRSLAYDILKRGGQLPNNLNQLEDEDDD